jgi:NitT/TauT family transport system substrate-binding protein
MTVRLATTRGSLMFFPVYLGNSLGYYGQEGVNLIIDETASAPKSMQGLLGGSADVVAGGFMSVLRMRAEDRPIQAFLLLVRDPGYVALVSPNTTRSIPQVESLGGATVGVSSPGSDQHQILNYILSRRGLKPEDVRVVGVGAGISAAMALEQGTIDVAMAYGTTVTRAKKRQPNIVTLFDLGLLEDRRKLLGVGEVAHSVLFANSDWMQKHPGLVSRIARATQRAVDWSLTHTPEDIRARLPDSLRTDDPDVDADAIRSVAATLAPDGLFKPEHIESTCRILSASDKKFSASDSRFSSTYTNQFVTSAKP